MNLKLSLNMDAPDIMLRGLQEKLPAITSCLSNFAEKYQLFSHAAQLKNNVIYYTEEAHNIANHAPHMSQVSILFRNTVAQYQKTIQMFLDATIRFLRETRVKLPGSDRVTTVIEVLNNLNHKITSMLERAMHRVAVDAEYASDVMIGMVSKIQVTMPIRDVMAGAKVLEQMRDRMKTMSNPLLDLLKNLQNVDVVLEKLGDTLKDVVVKAQDFVDNSLTSDSLDSIAVYINAFYEKYVTLMKTITEYANTAVNTESIKSMVDYFLDILISGVNQFKSTVTDYLQDAPAQYKMYVKVKGSRLMINL